MHQAIYASWKHSNIPAAIPDQEYQRLLDIYAPKQSQICSVTLKENTSIQAPWKQYRRTGLTEMRPYVPGEDLTGISVSQEDTPTEGGMIARNPDNAQDMWYVSQAYFEKNMELVEE